MFGSGRPRSCVGLIAVDYCEARCNGLSAFEEQAHRRRVDSRADVQRGYGPHLLLGDPESFAAGGNDPHRRGLREDGFDQVGRGVENMLAVVDHQQPHPALQRGGHRLAHALPRLLGDAQHRCHCIGYRRRIGDCGEFENPDTVGKFVGQPGRNLQGQARFADATYTGQRHQPMSLDRRLHLVEFGLASDEARGRGAQVSRTRIQCPQGGELRAQAPSAWTWNT